MQSSTSNIDRVLASFDDLWNPRILTRVNDWDIRLVKVRGEYVWHAHGDTDELFLVLDGALDIHLRETGRPERCVRLGRNDVFVVPRGAEHRPVSDDGATLMLFEPSGTLTTGDYAGEIPEHITSTTGTLAGEPPAVADR
ncbi:cupin domain-containing protein [Nocardia paucivorans]|uniref:cupin domain-containing protein n=1 Tax=Nocardia paucivorans TaxID=114259 RepID=UPI00030410E5|nr:cupin domain-containing protein [Nocardia paucivorans]